MAVGSFRRNRDSAARADGTKGERRARASPVCQRCCSSNDGDNPSSRVLTSRSSWLCPKPSTFSRGNGWRMTLRATATRQRTQGSLSRSNSSNTGIAASSRVRSSLLSGSLTSLLSIQGGRGGGGGVDPLQLGHDDGEGER